MSGGRQNEKYPYGANKGFGLKFKKCYRSVILTDLKKMVHLKCVYNYQDEQTVRIAKYTIIIILHLKISDKNCIVFILLRTNRMCLYA